MNKNSLIMIFTLFFHILLLLVKVLLFKISLILLTFINFKLLRLFKNEYINYEQDNFVNAALAAYVNSEKKKIKFFQINCFLKHKLY